METFVPVADHSRRSRAARADNKRIYVRPPIAYKTVRFHGMSAYVIRDVQ
jgi:hypothetical protein